jgi:glycerol kinase
MHGVVLTDGLDQPLRPAILWADTRSATLSAYHSLDAAILERLENPITAGMAGSTLLWLREHEPTVRLTTNNQQLTTDLYLLPSQFCRTHHPSLITQLSRD